jgi:predicted N-acetyltransferase YhbS
MLTTGERINPTPIVSIWNAACGADLRITSRLAEYNMVAATGAVQSGHMTLRNAQPVGFVLVSALPNDPSVSPPQAGWIDALAVLPDAQRQGVGSQLIKWAEEWLVLRGCTKVRLGGSLRPFVPGYPVELGNAAYFSKRGYAERAAGDEIWDVARDLAYYDSASAPVPSGIQIRPAQPGDVQAILDFFYREFPNRWRFEFQESLRTVSRLSDWMILLSDRGVDGFTRLTFEDSLQPYERFYPYSLPRPWGQLGPIGVSASLRGQGYGRAVLDAGLTHLRNHGVRGCVIDWTGLVDFYGKFGFKPYRRYAMLAKNLQPLQNS